MFWPSKTDTPALFLFRTRLVEQKREKKKSWPSKNKHTFLLVADSFGWTDLWPAGGGGGGAGAGWGLGGGWVGAGWGRGGGRGESDTMHEIMFSVASHLKLKKKSTCTGNAGNLSFLTMPHEDLILEDEKHVLSRSISSPKSEPGAKGINVQSRTQDSRCSGCFFRSTLNAESFQSRIPDRIPDSRCPGREENT